MKRRFSLLICGFLLIGSVFFIACSADPDDTETTYSVTTETYLRADGAQDTLNTGVGNITATPSSGPTGTTVTVTIIPVAGYVLEQVFRDGADIGTTNPVPVVLSDHNVLVKAIFKALPPDNFQIIVQQPTGGIISANPSYGIAGTIITLSNTPASGYIFDKYTATDADDGPVSVGGNSTFTLGQKNVTVTGSFKLISAVPPEELITAGKSALKAGNLDAAIAAYEAAYTSDPDNAEALIYSAIGKLASVATSSQVSNFFTNHLGLKTYPNKLDTLLNPQSWFDYYPDKDRAGGYYDSTLGESVWWVSKSNYTWSGGAEYFDKTYTQGDGYYYPGPYEFVSAERKYYDTEHQNPMNYYDDENGDRVYWEERESSWDYSYFDKYFPQGTGYYYGNSVYIFATSTPHHNSSSQPPLNVPGWLTGKDAYKDTFVTIGGESVASSSTWPLILIANLIDKNANGLNPALDDAITAIFSNPAYTEAVTRVASLKTKDPVLLDAEFIGAFGLSEFFGDNDIYIGWAELELLLSALKLVKGTLLYVDSYNWSYDIGFGKDLPWDESALGQIGTIIGNHRDKVLPLRANFMTDRGGNWLEDSRQAYVEAFTSIIGVYDYYTGDTSSLPNGYKAELEKFKNYRDLALSAKDAIDNKVSFTVPKDLLGEELSVNFGKLFTSGQLALENFIETEGTGNTKSPVFYSSARNPDGTLGTPTKINSANDITTAQGIGLKFKTTPIADIIGEKIAGYLLSGLGFVEFSGDDAYIFFDSMTGTIAWAVYHWENGGEDLVESFFGDGPAKSVARLR